MEGETSEEEMSFEEYLKVFENVVEIKCKRCGKYNTLSVTTHFQECLDCKSRFMKPDRPMCSKHPSLTKPCFSCKWDKINSQKYHSITIIGRNTLGKTMDVTHPIKIEGNHYMCFRENGKPNCCHDLDVFCTHSCHKRYSISPMETSI